MYEPPSSDRALAVLRALIEEHSSIHHVAQCLRMDHANLGRVLSGEYRLHLDLVEKILGVLGLPVSIFHRRCLKGYRLKVSEAAALVNSCRAKLGRGRMAKVSSQDEFLARIAKLQTGWFTDKCVHPGGTRRKELLQLEDARFTAPGEVTTKLEAMADDLLSVPATPQGRTDVAMVLAIWSTLRRIEGRREQSRDGYLAAFSFLEQVDDPFAQGFVMQKAAYLAMDFDRLDSSFLLLDGALSAFTVAGDPEWQARIFADRGIVGFLQKRWSDAEADLRRALALLPATSPRYRFAAGERLADILVETGRLEEAQQILSEASEFLRDTLARAFLAWRQGKLFSAQGQLPSAAERLWSAFAVMGANGEPLDTAMVAVDLAEVLLQLGRKNDLRSLITDTVAWMGRLAANRAAHQALVDLARLFYAGELNREKATEIRRDLEKGGRRGRPMRSWS